MNTFGLTKQQFERCIYSSGYIALLISKLVEAYEGYEYSLIDLHKIGEDSFSIMARPLKNEIKRKNIEFKELSKKDLLLLEIDPKKTTSKKIVFLPPSSLRGKIDVITNAINEETLKQYPYIQEFIDFLYENRISMNDEILFVQNMKTLFEKFLEIRNGETNHYIEDNFNKSHNICVINQKLFFRTTAHIVKKYERYSAVFADLIKIYDDNENPEFYDLVNRFRVFTSRKAIELTSYAGTYSVDEDNIRELFEQRSLPIQHYLLGIVQDGKSIFEELPIVSYFFCRLYELSKEKDEILPQDLEPIIAEIKNEYKRVRGS